MKNTILMALAILAASPALSETIDLPIKARIIYSNEFAEQLYNDCLEGDVTACQRIEAAAGDGDIKTGSFDYFEATERVIIRTENGE